MARHPIVQWKRLIHAWISALAASFLLCGCATPSFQPSTISANRIENRTLGFKGYTFTVPPEFQVFDAKRPTNADSPLIAELKRAHSRFVVELVARDRSKAFARVEESHFLYNDHVGVAFTIATMDTRRTLSQLTDQQKETLLVNTLNIATPSFGQKNAGSEQEIRKIGDHTMARISVQHLLHLRDGQEVLWQTEMAIVLGDLNELFMFTATSTPAHAAELISTVDQMTRNLQF